MKIKKYFNLTLCVLLAFCAIIWSAVFYSRNSRQTLNWGGENISLPNGWNYRDSNNTQMRGFVLSKNQKNELGSIWVEPKQIYSEYLMLADSDLCNDRESEVCDQRKHVGSKFECIFLSYKIKNEKRKIISLFHEKEKKLEGLLFVESGNKYPTARSFFSRLIENKNFHAHENEIKKCSSIVAASSR